MVPFGRPNLQHTAPVASPRLEQFRGSLYPKPFSKEISLRPFEMLRPRALTVTRSLSRGSHPSLFILVDGGDPSQHVYAPHLNQGLASAQAAEVWLIGSGLNSATLHVCPTVIVGCFFRKWHATLAPVRVTWPPPAIYFDKPHRWWYRVERRRKLLSFKHPPSMPNPIIHLRIGAAISSTGVQEYYEIGL